LLGVVGLLCFRSVPDAVVLTLLFFLPVIILVAFVVAFLFFLLIGGIIAFFRSIVRAVMIMAVRVRVLSAGFVAVIVLSVFVLLNYRSVTAQAARFLS
jgi:hypothetical protein